MQDARWEAVDAYLEDRLVGDDAALAAAERASVAAGLPPHQVSPLQGKFLHLLARVVQARRVLEIGTLGGYSTIWLARALGADGMLDTCEADSRHADVAQANLAAAGVAHRVRIHRGLARETLARLEPPYDLCFIDADKPSNPLYLAECLRLARVGTVIVADNVVRAGAVADAASDDASVQGVRAFMDLVRVEPRLCATALQTVGCKGHDGFAIALVVA